MYQDVIALIPCNIVLCSVFMRGNKVCARLPLEFTMTCTKSSSAFAKIGLGMSGFLLVKILLDRAMVGNLHSLSDGTNGRGWKGKFGAHKVKILAVELLLCVRKDGVLDG